MKYNSNDSQIRSANDSSFLSKENNKINVVKHNLIDLNRRISELTEIRLLQLDELVSILTQEEPDAETDRILAILSSVLQSLWISKNHDAVNSYIEMIDNTLTNVDTVVLCSQVARLLEKGNEFTLDQIFGYNEQLNINSRGIVSYFRNNFTDSAFNSFKGLISFVNPKANYTVSYVDACEQVFNGFSEYCILPISNNDSGILTSFYSLIRKYELKICAVININQQEGSEEINTRTRYALLSKILPEYIISSNGRSFDFFEIDVLINNFNNILSIFNISKSLGLKLTGINTYNVTGEETKFHLCFDVKNADLLPFLIYLTAFYYNYIPIGLYSVIE